jgi:uncharacterized protein DUF6184
MRRAQQSLVGAALVLGGFAACIRTERVVLVERHAGPMTHGQAADALAKAFCARAKRCRNVGWDKEYEDVETCINKRSGDAGKALDADDCKHGVDGPALDNCVGRIADADCDETPDVDDIRACDEEVVCVDVD